ncbi:MAG TPA: hypothetical protein VMX36_09220 [Sedimentisphaerales bacterium]|nr:hypothetical protein [Sedimentisphaerales bacterium]
MSNSQSLRRKWRRWCRAIEDDLLDQYKYDKLIYEGYIEIIESNKTIQSPADFHNWCCQNYGNSLLLYIRKLSDKNSRSYSIRKLVGDIAENHRLVTKYACLRCYQGHHRQDVLDYWDKNIGSNCKFLPKAKPLKDIKKIKSLTTKPINIVNKSVAHFDRTNRIRTIEFEEADKIIFKLVEILHFYSVLIGEEIACDTGNCDIDNDWKSIFNRAWAGKLYRWGT